MRLKHLKLQGYKTFASRTEFVFDEGITAIVGPNGSGKSNVADALRWVLGEQSFSTLRGKRGVDMIFTGSQSRPRAGMAQALLTLDNSDGWLPIDYTEVEIGRRTYRSGDTEYLLNGQQVRLMDITDLLATSGLAGRTYTFIGQGLVDQALSLRADERRALFEEAAGISHYQARRAETLRRLQETQRNLERVYDILAEIRPRLASLKRQANRAENYRQVQADLRHLLRIWYGFQWEKSRRDLRRLRGEADDAQRNWEEGRQELLARQSAIGRGRRQISTLQQQLSQHQSARDELRERQEQARRQVAVLQERGTLLARQIAEIEGELPGLEEGRERAQTQLDAAVADLERAQEELNRQRDAFGQFEASSQAQEVEIRRWEQTVATAALQRRDAQNRLSQVEGQLVQLRERLDERRDAAGDGPALADAEAGVERLAAEVAEAETAVAQLRQERTAVQEERQTVLSRLKALRQAGADHNRELNQRQNEVARLEAQREMLDQMRQSEGQVPADVPLVGRLAELITIPADYRAALEAALAARLGALVVPDESALWRLVEQGRRDGSVTAVAASAIPPTASPQLDAETAAIGWAADLVSCPPAVRPVVQLLLGRVLLVGDERAAYAIARRLPPGALAVTPGGFVVYAGGLVQTNSHDPQAGPLAREEAFRQAEARLAEQRGHLAQAQADAEAGQTKIQALQEAADRLNEAEQRRYRAEQEAAGRLADAQRRLDRARQQVDYIRQQQAENAAQVTRLTERIEAAETAVTGQQSQIVRLETAHSQAQSRLEALPVAELQQQRQNWQQKIDAAGTIVAGRQAVVDSRRATLNQADELLARRRARREALRRQQEQMNLDEAQSELGAIGRQMAALDDEINPLKERLTQSQARLEELEEALEEQQQRAHELENFYTQARIRHSQHESHIDGLRERIQADLGLVALDYDDDQTVQSPLPISEIVEQLPDVETLPDDIEASIHRYRGQLQRMGAINPDAPAEYAETQERYDFLSGQIEDLEQTEVHLRHVIAELDDLTSRAFAETVEEVDAIFGKMFTRLFGGGSAKLALTDPDDLTASGVDIVARLPSRREQGLGLLSGGERSLTAAALIFALLKVSPPPFCVMDEVDAMLDEANVNRFREALRELAQETQFIVITHNRGTVQAARTVYGISMGGDSASQVLSIRPEDYVNGRE